MVDGDYLMMIYLVLNTLHRQVEHNKIFDGLMNNRLKIDERLVLLHNELKIKR
jgi:hypothetical protein